MNDGPLNGAARPEIRKHVPGDSLGAWIVITLFVAAWMLAYAFAVNGWNIAGDKPYEADIATGWHELGAPTETDLAKRY